MKNKLLLFFISTISLLSAKIIEINSIAEVKPYLDKKYLVVFDLDNTIMEPVQELGTDQWFYYYLNKCMNQNLTKQEALHKSLRCWIAIQSFSKMQLVEKQIKEIIDSLQARDMDIMGMTTRDMALSLCTLDQLRELKIDLKSSALSRKEIYRNNEGSVLFKEGVLFTSGTHKGRALLDTLNTLKYKPKAIIFINDKKSNIMPVQEECDRRGVEFLGFRYGFLDEKVANFDKNIADVQFKHFGNILSDKEAKKLIEN